jgi:Fe-S-cluster containining protein
MTEESEIFQCQQCGYCCQGETTVSLDSADVDRMLEHLGIKHAEAAEKYWKTSGNIIQMKTPDGACIFYSKGCTIHPGKPWRCSQWPLHPSILADRMNFETIKRSCPGINHEMSYEEFCHKLRSLLEASKQRETV